MEGSNDVNLAAGDSKVLGSDIVVTSVESPHASVRVGKAVFSSNKKASRHGAFESIRGAGREFKVEVVERTLVRIVLFSREPVGHGKVQRGLVAAKTSRCAFNPIFCYRRTKIGPREKRGFMTGKDGIETSAKNKRVEGCGGRNDCGTQGTREMRQTIFFHSEICHSEKRFAKEHSANSTGDLVVNGRCRRFARDFPKYAPGKRKSGRCPETQAGRASRRMINRSLIGMEKLVDLELVVIHNPTAF